MKLLKISQMQLKRDATLEDMDLCYRKLALLLIEASTLDIVDACSNVMLSDEKITEDKNKIEEIKIASKCIEKSPPG